MAVSSREVRCLLGRHAFMAMRQADRTDGMGRPNPFFDRCRRCGHERDRPVERWDRPDMTTGGPL